LIMAYELEEELEALPEFEEEFEGEEELEAEDEGEAFLGGLGNIVGGLLGEEEGEEEFEGEFEDELEGEFEFEGGSSLTRRIYPDAMMEHLGELAAESETEDEAAEHFLPLVGMAASKLLPVVAKAVAPAAKKLLPKIAKAVTKAQPHLTRSIGKVARTLHRNPQTRHLLKVVPSITRRAVGSVARQAAHGRRVTPHAAVRTLARHARHVLGSPRHRKHALRHHHRLERHFHHRHGRGYPRHYGVRGRGYAPGYSYGPGGVRRPVAGGYRRLGAGRAARTVAPGVQSGRMVGGVCTCGGSEPAAAPAYCRCCGQLLR
jgi:hypothetical protein